MRARLAFEVGATASLTVALGLATSGCGSTTIVEDSPDTTSSASTTTSGSGGAGGQPGQGGATTTATGGAGQGGAGAGGAGGGASDGPWRADLWIGQIDHLSIRHQAVDADVCVFITASAPGQNTTYEVTIPAPWAIDQVTLWDDTTGCMDDPFTPSGDPVPADEAVGAIALDVPPMEFYPCELDVDIEASFPADPPWLPPTLTLKAAMIDVGGTCD